MGDNNVQLDTDTFLRILRKYVRQTEGSNAITMESNLYMLGLDSMTAVNLLLELEDAYGVVFPDVLLTESTFETPLALKLAIVSLK
jgi:acyl carrier protein